MNGTLIAPQMKSFGPKKFQIPYRSKKLSFWQFFREGRDGRALLVRPSRIPHRISKILFASCADEFLAMLEGKIREDPFFYVLILQNNSVKILTGKNVKHTFFPAIAQDSNSKHKFFSPVHDLEFHIYHVELQTLKIHKKNSSVRKE